MGVCVGVIIETLQFILPVNRVVQLSDVVYNALSSVLGFVFMGFIFMLKMLITKIFKKTNKKHSILKQKNQNL